MHSPEELDILRFNAVALTEEELKWCLDHYDYLAYWEGLDGKQHESFVNKCEVDGFKGEALNRAIERAYLSKKQKWSVKEIKPFINRGYKDFTDLDEIGEDSFL